jgi:hypothetical protein
VEPPTAACGRSETVARKLTEGLLCIAKQPLEKSEVI